MRRHDLPALSSKALVSVLPHNVNGTFLCVCKRRKLAKDNINSVNKMFSNLPVPLKVQRVSRKSGANNVFKPPS